MIQASPSAAAHRIPPFVPPPRPAQAAKGGRVFELLEELVPVRRRIVQAGDPVFRAGDRFAELHLIHSGFFKSVTATTDGREQVAALHLKGDWLGFDGIAAGRYGCDAIAMDTGELWSVRHDALLQAAIGAPELLTLLHCAMSEAIGRDRDQLMSVCTLPADARVAEFLHHWAESLAERGLRTDRIALRMSRAEIGSHLGMTLESVSRALARLAREGIIGLDRKSRRDVRIPGIPALAAFVQQALAGRSGEVLQ
jgi:CRP/FNR family transcriptional regulator